MEGCQEMPVPGTIWIKREPDDCESTAAENREEVVPESVTQIKTDPEDFENHSYISGGIFNSIGENIKSVCNAPSSDPSTSALKIWEGEDNEESDMFLPLEVSCIEGESGDDFIQKVAGPWGSAVNLPYTCYHCEENRRTFKSLKSHIKKIHLNNISKLVKTEQGSIFQNFIPPLQNKRHKCPFCPYSTVYLFNLRSHVIGVHTDERPFKCSQCDYQTAYARALRTHVRSVHAKEKPYRCSKCRYTTAHSGHLKSHIRGVHSNERPHHCQWCSYSTAYPRALRVHVMALHTNEKPYKCSDCDYKSSHSSDLKFHVMNHHTFEKPHHCPYCPYSSAQLGHMKTHVMAVHTRERPHKCPYCDFSSAYSLTLKSHVENLHKNQSENYKLLISKLQKQNDPNSGSQNNPIYSGKEDEDLPTNKPELATTMQANVTPRPMSNLQLLTDNPVFQPKVEFTTLDCDPFTFLSNQKNPHLVESSSKQKKVKKLYQCQQCDDTFPQSKHLKYHMKAEHPGLKIFQCTQCEFTAPKHSLLKYHILGLHKAANGVKVHRCPKCPYCTGNYQKFQVHVRSKHNRVRPFKCPHCPYSSTQAAHIKIHVRAKHTEERPYHCSYCGYQSAYSNALKSHIIKRHTNE